MYLKKKKAKELFRFIRLLFRFIFIVCNCKETAVVSFIVNNLTTLPVVRLLVSSTKNDNF